MSTYSIHIIYRRFPAHSPFHPLVQCSFLLRWPFLQKRLWVETSLESPLLRLIVKLRAMILTVEENAMLAAGVW